MFLSATQQDTSTGVIATFVFTTLFKDWRKGPAKDNLQLIKIICKREPDYAYLHHRRAKGAYIFPLLPLLFVYGSLSTITAFGFTTSELNIKGMPSLMQLPLIFTAVGGTLIFNMSGVSTLIRDHAARKLAPCCCPNADYTKTMQIILGNQDTIEQLLKEKRLDAYNSLSNIHRDDLNMPIRGLITNSSLFRIPNETLKEHIENTIVGDLFIPLQFVMQIFLIGIFQAALWLVEDFSKEKRPGLFSDNYNFVYHKADTFLIITSGIINFLLLNALNIIIKNLCLKNEFTPKQWGLLAASGISHFTGAVITIIADTGIWNLITADKAQLQQESKVDEDWPELKLSAVSFLIMTIITTLTFTPMEKAIREAPQQIRDWREEKKQRKKSESSSADQLLMADAAIRYNG